MHSNIPKETEVRKLHKLIKRGMKLVKKMIQHKWM